MTQIHIKSGALVETLNKMGYMNGLPEFYNEAFIDYSSQTSGPCLEIGSAFGYSTIKALKKGARMFANDLCPEHLDILRDNTPEDLKENLTLVPGAFPHNLSFENNMFSGILCSRMLNFLHPEDLLPSLKQIFNWIKEGGKFFFLVSSPYMVRFERFLPEYIRRKQEKIKWPGWLQDVSHYVSQNQNIPSSIYLMDIEEVKELLCEAGFHIEKIGYSGLTHEHFFDFNANGQEHVGAIALKPLKV
jgi:SAM-dependent methyltransferase